MQGWREALLTDFDHSKVTRERSRSRRLQRAALDSVTSIFALVDKFGKVASLKQRSIICQFESDQGYHLTERTI